MTTANGSPSARLEVSTASTALKTFFKILEREQIPIEALDVTLRQIAKQLRAELRLTIVFVGEP